MMKKTIDLKILIDNDNYLKEYSVDNNESITPTTDRGYFSFEKAIEKLQKLENAQKELEETEDKKIQEEDVVSSKSFLDGAEKEYLSSIIKFIKENPVFIKKYQYEDSESSNVLRFGIKCFDEKLKDWVKTNYNQVVKNTIKISDTLSCLSKQSKHEQFLEKIIHYTSQSKEQITPFEKNIVEQAINYLDNTKNKTALVDFFVRDKGTGKIKLTKSGEIETHSIVLYKQEGKYLVIDPSNAEFSSVLVGTHDDIKICLSKDFRIYTPQDNTGYGQDLWRDCIDIAVKLAFNLSKCSDYIELKEIKGFQFIDDSSLRKNLAIEAITNQQDISGKFPSILEEQNARAKQSSNIKESHLTSLFIKLLHQKNTILEEKLESSIYTHQKKHYTNKEYLNDYISQKVEIHKDYISSLEKGIGVIESSINEVNEFNTETEMNLIGEL